MGPRDGQGSGGELAGQVAFVTGGARGLGAAICRTLAASGVTVVAGDVRADEVSALVESIRAAGDDAHALALELTDEAQVQVAVGETQRAHGRLDILIKNAGTDVTLPVEEMSVAEWDRVIETNLRAPFLTSKFALPLMKEARRGHIVNISSTAAKRAWANASAYHASKWGLLGLSHALHVEARPFNVKVTALLAGGMRTPFLLERFPDIDVETLQDPANVAETVKFVLTTPAGTVIPELMVIPLTETSWP
jgi:NAD(P)-dependent dehydrogenase (short-subunit alcohol dehydrogenase family)